MSAIACDFKISIPVAGGIQTSAPTSKENAAACREDNTRIGANVISLNTRIIASAEVASIEDASKIIKQKHFRSKSLVASEISLHGEIESSTTDTLLVSSAFFTSDSPMLMISRFIFYLVCMSI